MHMNGSESFLYGQNVGGKGSRDGTPTAGMGMGAGGLGVGVGGTRQMFEREQMTRVGEVDEDGGHGRRRGFWSALCCRA